MDINRKIKKNMNKKDIDNYNLLNVENKKLWKSNNDHNQNTGCFTQITDVDSKTIRVEWVILLWRAKGSLFIINSMQIIYVFIPYSV